MKLIRKLWGDKKQVIQVYSASPKKPDLKGELNKFQIFKVWILEAVGIGAEHYLAKVAIPRLKMENLILDNELKRQELQKMRDVVEEVGIYQEIEEVEGKVYTEQDVQALLEELNELKKTLKLVHGATIEHEEIEKAEEEPEAPHLREARRATTDFRIHHELEYIPIALGTISYTKERRASQDLDNTQLIIGFQGEHIYIKNLSDWANIYDKVYTELQNLYARSHSP